VCAVEPIPEWLHWQEQSLLEDGILKLNVSDLGQALHEDEYVLHQEQKEGPLALGHFLLRLHKQLMLLLYTSHATLFHLLQPEIRQK